MVMVTIRKYQFFRISHISGCRNIRLVGNDYAQFSLTIASKMTIASYYTQTQNSGPLKYEQPT